MKRLLLVLFLIGAFLNVNAQIEFDKTEHDFGTIEEGTQATHVFKFKNTGKKPIRLTRVAASCGCTTPHWTREEVAPGKTGEIKVVYNSKGRPGYFTKTVTVQYEVVGDENNHPNPVLLKIKGKVNQGAKSEYSQVDGNTAFKTRRMFVGELKSDDKPKNFIFEVKNIGQKPIKFLGAKTLPMFEVTFNPEILHPGQTGQIIVTYRSDKAKESGYTVDKGIYYDLVIKTDDQVAPEKHLVLSGSFKRVYSPEEIANSPKIVFQEKEFDAGDILEGEKLVHDFYFRNEGKSDLVIESVRASCGCTATAPEKKTIKPGESSYIRATFNSTGRTGPQHKTITVISNDVTNPRVILHLKSNVVKNAFNAPQGPVENK